MMEKVLITALGAGRNEKEKNIRNALKESGSAQQFKDKLAYYQISQPAIHFFSEHFDDLQNSDHCENLIHEYAQLYGLKYNDDQYKYSYHVTNYKYMSDEIPLKSAFAADILGSHICPQITFVIGTISSCWEEFYQKHAQHPDEEGLKQILNAKKDAGLYAKESQLDRMQDLLNRAFSGSEKSGNHALGRIIPIVIFYGINDEQLDKNYLRISKMFTQKLDSKKEYEISMDITYSFRSLPIYNLTILNYLSKIKQQKIVIKHVFYACFEAKEKPSPTNHEGSVPIVDLSVIEDIQSITEGLEVFRKIGNADDLAEKIKGDAVFKNALNRFGYGLEMNNLNEIQSAARDLITICDNSSEHDRYFLVKKNVAGFINDFFPQEDLWNDDRQDHLTIGRFQRLCTEWYVHNKRYGAAALTGIEAMKNDIMDTYTQYMRDLLGVSLPADVEDDVSFQKSAIPRLHTSAVNYQKKFHSLSDEEQETLQFMQDLRHSYDSCKSIRIPYAHNVKNKEDNVLPANDIDEIKIIHNMISLLKRLEQEILSDSYFKKIYTYNNLEETVKMKNLVLIGNEDVKAQNVFAVPEKIYKGDRPYSGLTIYSIGLYLNMYFKQNKQIKVVLQGFDEIKSTDIAVLLNALDFKNIFIQADNKSGMQIFKSHMKITLNYSESDQLKAINHVLNVMKE